MDIYCTPVDWVWRTDRATTVVPCAFMHVYACTHTAVRLLPPPSPFQVERTPGEVYWWCEETDEVTAVGTSTASDT